MGPRPYQFQVLAQVVGPRCWSLPKPMYNVTDKQVDHSSSFLWCSCWHHREDRWWVLMTPVGDGPLPLLILTVHLVGLPFDGHIEWLGLNLGRINICVCDLSKKYVCVCGIWSSIPSPNLFTTAYPFKLQIFFSSFSDLHIVGTWHLGFPLKA